MYLFGVLYLKYFTFLLIAMSSIKGTWKRKMFAYGLIQGTMKNIK